MARMRASSTTATGLPAFASCSIFAISSGGGMNGCSLVARTHAHGLSFGSADRSTASADAKYGVATAM
jgi:hypothetical protein